MANVSLKALSPEDHPVTITRPEFMRRMKDMQAVGGGGGMAMFGGMPENYNLVVNVNHPIIGKVMSEKDNEKKQDIIKQTADLALLSQNMLKGEELTNFINRSIELI